MMLLVVPALSGCLGDEVEIKDISVRYDQDEDVFIARIYFEATSQFDLSLEYPSDGDSATNQVTEPVVNYDSGEKRMVIILPEPGEYIATARIDGELMDRFSKNIDSPR